MSRQPDHRAAGLDEDGLPTGSTLRAKMNSARMAAGIESVEEEIARKDMPAPSRNISLTLCCSLLMIVASRASQNLAREMGDTNNIPLESMRMISYGFTLMNLMGGFGAITFGIFPGKVAWVHQLMEEASTSIGTALLAIGIAGLTDESTFWTSDELSTSRFAIVGIGGIHTVLKSMFYSRLASFVQVTAFVSAVLMFQVALRLHSTSIGCCACLSIASNMRHHKRAFPFLSTRGVECSYLCLALMCFLLETTCLKLHAEGRVVTHDKV